MPQFESNMGKSVTYCRVSFSAVLFIQLQESGQQLQRADCKSAQKNSRKLNIKSQKFETNGCLLRKREFNEFLIALLEIF